uniref:Uncharacterized protein n=1 Tax=Sphaerodactylus townsendi TaxID=933632 RepID=A0ACB8ERK9_9SAUR
MQACFQQWGRLVSRGAHLAGPYGSVLGGRKVQSRWGRRGQQGLAGLRRSSTGGEGVGAAIAAASTSSRHIEKLLPRHDDFSERHIGPGDKDKREMLQTVGLSSIDELIGKTIPANIGLQRPLKMDDHISANCHLSVNLTPCGLCESPDQFNLVSLKYHKQKLQTE